MYSNWEGARPMLIPPQAPLQVHLRLLGGMQGPDPLPKLTPPADIVVQHLGGVPSGWHVRDIFFSSQRGTW
eukprot:2600410-Prorocentrum_lima.AAC.1